MKRRLFPLAAALLLASPLSLAAAGDMHGMHDCPMHHAGATDADHAKHLDAMFAMLDADASGSIDRAEFDRHHEQMRRQHAAPAGQAGPGDGAAPAPAAKPEDERAAHH